MDQTLLIFASIALAAIAALCISLVIVAFRASKNLDQMTQTLDSVGRDVSEMRAQTMPLLEEATSAMKRADAALEKVDKSIDQISQGATVIKNIAQDARDLEKAFIDRIQQPLDDLGSLAAGTVRGFTTFLKSLLDR